MSYFISLSLSGEFLKKNWIFVVIGETKAKVLLLILK